MAKKNLTLEEKLEEAIVKDGPYEMPGNWVWSKLGSVIELISGRDVSSTHCNEEHKGIPYILGASNIKDGIFIAERWIEKPVVIAKRNDILLSCKGTIGKTIIIDEEINISRQIMSIRCGENIELKYIKFFIDSYVNTLIEQSKGLIPGITREDVLSIKIPLPPLKEQQRIVDRIETLFEKLDKAKELIEEVREGFEKRKSAVLVKAFTGVLTEKWRENNYINNSGLLDNIIDENRKIKKNFILSDSDELHDIPNNWSWIKLKDICEKFKYGTSAKSQTEGNVPVLRMGNLQQGKLVWDSLVYTSDDDEINKYDLIKGDLLFNRTNSPELVGKTSIYNGEMEAIFAGYLIRVRVLNGIESKYINYFMNSIYAKTRCMEVKSDGVSQSNINAEKLGDFDIPLPSTEEQKEIVRILDKLLEEEDKIDELTQLEGQIELIKKSILAKAFRGELGTNSEEDESALELLKKIINKE